MKCKECGAQGVGSFFWHCRYGVGSATCLKCGAPDYFEMKKTKEGGK